MLGDIEINLNKFEDFSRAFLKDMRNIFVWNTIKMQMLHWKLQLKSASKLFVFFGKRMKQAIDLISPTGRRKSLSIKRFDLSYIRPTLISVQGDKYRVGKRNIHNSCRPRLESIREYTRLWSILHVHSFWAIKRSSMI